MDLKDAIRERRLIEFTYDGLPRVAQPATLGVSTTGKESLRACLVGGLSRRNSLPCWELYTVGKMVDLHITDQIFVAFDEEGYTRNDSAFVVVAAEH